VLHGDDAKLRYWWFGHLVQMSLFVVKSLDDPAEETKSFSKANYITEAFCRVRVYFSCVVKYSPYQKVFQTNSVSNNNINIVSFTCLL
jgi:hypothetical protein